MKKGWIIAVILAIALLAIMYFGSYFESFGKKNDDSVNTNGTQVLKTITAKREFKNGTHTITGTVDLPTPCHGLSIESTITRSKPEQVALNFTSSTTAESCAQVITSVSFSEKFDASGYAIIRAYWNGEPARLLFTTN